MTDQTADSDSASMAPDINADARAQRDKAIAALDQSRQSIYDRWAGMTDSQKLDAMKQLHQIADQKLAVQGAFIDDIANSKAHQAIIQQLKDVTGQMNQEAAKVAAAATFLNNAATVINDAAQVVSLFAMFAA